MQVSSALSPSLGSSSGGEPCTMISMGGSGERKMNILPHNASANMPIKTFHNHVPLCYNTSLVEGFLTQILGASSLGVFYKLEFSSLCEYNCVGWRLANGGNNVHIPSPTRHAAAQHQKPKISLLTHSRPSVVFHSQHQQSQTHCWSCRYRVLRLIMSFLLLSELH